MPRHFALAIALVFIGWLFARDRKRGESCSRALWIPLLWLLIIGSRPVSAWLNGGQLVGGDNQEGSPLDRNVYLGFIFAGMLVLKRRRINWAAFFSNNRWLVFYFVFLGISVTWADDPFVAFKRWFKDCGNIIMVLVILSEADPVLAVRLILIRFAYVIIPLSVVFIRYFPDIGRYYNPFIWTYSYGGVATDKNILGMSLLLCGIGICWGILHLWNQKLRYRKDMFAHVLLLGICMWLWSIAHCATSMACTAVGACILCSSKVPFMRNAMQRFGLSGLVIVSLLVLVMNLLVDPIVIVTSALGRDVTLTGRTDIWQQVLEVNINPWIGTGYFSFWHPDRAQGISDALGFFFVLKEAHNGYIEAYLNTGLIGLALLAILLLRSVKRSIKLVSGGDSYETFRFAALVVAMLYNVTESAFCSLVVIWFLVLLAMIDLPQFANGRPGVERFAKARKRS